MCRRCGAPPASIGAGVRARSPGGAGSRLPAAIGPSARTRPSAGTRVRARIRVRTRIRVRARAGMGTGIRTGGGGHGGLGGAAAGPAAEPPGRLDHAADRHGQSQSHQQPGPRAALEGLAADPADEERIAGPQDPGDRGAQHEAPPRVPDETAGESHRGPAARNEPAGHDDPGAILRQRPLRPRAAAFPPLARENPPADGRAEPAAQQVGGVVADECAERGQRDQHRDARVGAPRGRDAEGDDRGLAGQDRDQRVEGGHENRDEVGNRGADIQLGQVDHQRPPRCRDLSSRASTTASVAPKMIHGAITIRSLPVMPSVHQARMPGRWSCHGDGMEPGPGPRVQDGRTGYHSPAARSWKPGVAAWPSRLGSAATGGKG